MRLASGLTTLGMAAVLSTVVSTGAASAGSIQVGTYRLHNHPDGNAAQPFYGLRLDELFNVTRGHDIFTFDFDAPGAAMYMAYDGRSIRIYGTAFGGLDRGSSYDPNWSSLVTIDFTYRKVFTAPGDDDLIVPRNQRRNTGSIIWEKTGKEIALKDFPGNHPYTFRFGDEDHDRGHRGFAGLSGWGWLNHRGNRHVYNSDWLFTGTLIPLPAPVWMGLAGLAGVAIVRRRRKVTTSV